jgi:hypothetical protein
VDNCISCNKPVTEGRRLVSYRDAPKCSAFPARARVEKRHVGITMSLPNLRQQEVKKC